MKKALLGKTILVVDDEADLREIIAEDIEMLGATVHSADSGRAAFEIAKRVCPHVIVSDVRMAGGDGIELLKSVRGSSLNPQPAFFLITGFSDVTPDEAEKLGAQGMLSKPFNLKQLREMVIASANEVGSAGDVRKSK
jgi:CheY-like chemotaxis protein